MDTASLEEVELNGPRLRYVRAIIEDSSGRIWIGHEDGLTMLTMTILTYTTDEDFRTTVSVRSLRIRLDS